MRYSFRLAELLGHVPNPRKRPGTIKAIVEYTGLDRHQVAALLKNEVKYIPLRALSRLCDYLIDHGHVSEDQLPGALFAIESENFWELLARRQRLELCLGVRRDQQQKGSDAAWVVASDSVLLGELLNGVSTLGGTTKLREEAHSHEEASAPLPPHPENIKQSLVWSPGQVPADEVRQRADEVYDGFDELAGDKALICLGSMKSNPVVELMLTEAFGGEPFVPQVDVDEPNQRSIPFFVRYRADDPNATSIAAGSFLSKNTRADAPGIYYEQAGGKWAHCAWDEPQHDAAFVFYVHRESQGRLEMALAGFSGRATRLLAKSLATRAQDFWPPTYEGQGIQVGAYIVQFTFTSQDTQSHDILLTDLSAATRVIPLDGESIARRLQVSS